MYKAQCVLSSWLKPVLWDWMNCPFLESFVFLRRNDSSFQFLVFVTVFSEISVTFSSIYLQSSFSKHTSKAAEAVFGTTFAFLHLPVTGLTAVTSLICTWLLTFILQKARSAQMMPLYLPISKLDHQISACFVYARLICYTYMTLLQNPYEIQVPFTT